MLYKNKYTGEIGPKEYFQWQQADDILRFNNDSIISVGDYTKYLEVVKIGEIVSDSETIVCF